MNTTSRRQFLGSSCATVSMAMLATSSAPANKVAAGDRVRLAVALAPPITGTNIRAAWYRR